MPSTYPLSPHFTNPRERQLLAEVLRKARTLVLDPARPAKKHRWSRGYHVRHMADFLLRSRGRRHLAERLWQCPLWRGDPTSLREEAELATDGRIFREWFDEVSKFARSREAETEPTDLVMVPLIKEQKP